MHPTDCFFVLSADPALGKVDKSTLSQQTLMELLVAKMESETPIWGSDWNPTIVPAWAKVEHEIIKIDWFHCELSGSLPIEWLPLSVVYFSVLWNILTGTIDLTCLPDGLVTLTLSSNSFFGYIDLISLPSGLKDLSLNNNNFSCEANFDHLPSSIEHLSVAIKNYDLYGEVHSFPGTSLSIEGTQIRDMRKNY